MAWGESVSRASARDEAWTEYVNTLEDSLTEPKEFVVSRTSSQDIVMNEMKEGRDGTKHKTRVYAGE